MATERSRNIYKHPFCKGYWVDAVSELKSTKMLVFAALIIALRVALKSVRIPLGVNLDITPAFLANVLGAMIYGPVVGAVGAVISDFLGVMLRGDTYFLPYVLTEVASSVIFAMFFYRQKHSTTRAIISRFIICLFINVLLQSQIDLWWQDWTYGKRSEILLIPRILKNLFMFPIEVVMLTLFLSVITPITSRMRLTFTQAEKISFTKKQVVLLVVLVVVGIGSVIGYLFYHYDNTSLSSAYTSAERLEKNKAMQTYVLEQSDEWDNVETVTIIDSAMQKFMGSKITYTVLIYEVDQQMLDQKIQQMKAEDPESKFGLETIWGYSKSPAKKEAEEGTLTHVATATIVVDKDSGEVYSFATEPV